MKYTIEKINIVSINNDEEVLINDKVFENNTIEYRIINRENEIENIIDWISRSKSPNDKYLMKLDLQKLMNLDDDFILYSSNTNDYISKNDCEFNDLIEQMINKSKELELEEE